MNLDKRRAHLNDILDLGAGDEGYFSDAFRDQMVNGLSFEVALRFSEKPLSELTIEAFRVSSLLQLEVQVLFDGVDEVIKIS